MGHPPQIPLTPQTNENAFPRYDAGAAPGKSGHPYPYMLHYEFLPEHREAWQEAHKQYDEQKNKYYWIERCPKARAVRKDGVVIVGDPVAVLSTQDLVDSGYANVVGEPVIVRDAAEEKIVCDILGIPTRKEREQQAKSVTIDMASGELVRLKQQNADLEAELERNVRLKEAKQQAAQAAKKDSKAVKQRKPTPADNLAKARAVRAANVAARKRSLEDLASMGDKD
jgi:hypothetical protein